MLANFQFKAGVGGHFFLRLLIYRWGLGPMPRANSYWNEFHFPVMSPKPSSGGSGSDDNILMYCIGGLFVLSIINTVLILRK